MDTEHSPSDTKQTRAFGLQTWIPGQQTTLWQEGTSTWTECRRHPLSDMNARRCQTGVPEVGGTTYKGLAATWGQSLTVAPSAGGQRSRERTRGLGSSWNVRDRTPKKGWLWVGTRGSSAAHTRGRSGLCPITGPREHLRFSRTCANKAQSQVQGLSKSQHSSEEVNRTLNFTS